MQMGGDRELLFRLLCSPHGLALLAAGHTAHVNATNLRLALMDRCVLVTEEAACAQGLVDARHGQGCDSKRES